jgi:hypothetical protein
MRWLMIGLLGSLGGLLFAAAGVAYHIIKQRAKLKSDSSITMEPTGESDLETKR